MGGIKRKPKKGEGTVGDLVRYIPSAIVADHSRNYSREANEPTPDELRPFLGEKCCFTLAQIEARLASLKANKQIHSVGVYLTGTCEAHLVFGFLRHAAMLLAEVRGELDQIPESYGKIRCDLVREPTSAADWLEIASTNFTENTESLPLSPANKAAFAARLLAPPEEGGFGLDRETARQRLGLTDDRQLNRYLRLLKLPPDVVAKVHRGQITMSAALSESTKQGRAGSPGPRRGIKHRDLRRALTRPEDAPQPLSQCETLALLGIVAGDDIDDKTPRLVKEWAEWLSTAPEPLPKESKRKARKKQPPKPGEVGRGDG